MYQQLVMEFEEWRPVVGYEGLYEISNKGRARRVKPSRRSRMNYILTPIPKQLGYTCYHLCDYESKAHKVHIHKMVAEAFIGPRPEGHEINHKDGNRANNTLSNLEYVTPSENRLHSYRVLNRHIPKGSERWNAKLTEDIVREIRAAELQHGDMTRLAEKYGVNTATISAVVLGKIWKHAA